MTTEAPPRPRLVPGRLRPTGRAREGLFALVVGGFLSALFNFPVVLHPKSLVTGDLGDPLLQAWQLAWQQHFVTGGGALWTGNTLFPAPDSFAFSDSLLGYLPLALFGEGQYAAVFRYNLAYLIAFALAYAGAYLLVRQLGGNWQAAALAGAAFAWAPWRLTHISHLNILSSGGIALALFALARGHGYSLRHGRRPELARPWWAFTGWVVAAWQVTLGFAVGLPFSYLLGGVGLVILVVALRRWRTFGTRLAVLDGTGVAVFLVVTYLMTVPYRRVVGDYGFVRRWAEVQAFSPPPEGLLTSVSTWLWQGSVFDPYADILVGPDWLLQSGASEKILFPGLALLLVAVAGLFVSAWSVRVRLALGISTVVVFVFALGSRFFGGAFTYYVLWKYLPGWDALRTPGRLMLWVILLLILLAAGALTRAGEWLRDRDTTYDQGRFLQVLLVVPALFALLEGIPVVPHPSPPGIPPDLAATFRADPRPAVVLPMVQEHTRPFSEYVYQFWSVEGFPALANGVNGLQPPQYTEVDAALKTFPDVHSVDVLRKYGIPRVLVLKVGVAGTPYEQALTKPLDGLPLTRTESTDLVTFTLRQGS